MVRVITQETYDEVVRENMNDFDMPADEAIQDANKQFEAQGVDLTNIIKDLTIQSDSGVHEHRISQLIKRLKCKCDGSKLDEHVMNKLLTDIQLECDKGIEYKVRGGYEGLYQALIKCIEIHTNTRMQVLRCLLSLMDGQPDLLDQQGVGFMKRNLSSSETSDQVKILTLKWISLCCLKHEKNRQNIYNTNMTQILTDILNTSKNIQLISECLVVMRRLSLDDDVRVEYGNAHELTRSMAIDNIKTLTHMLSEYGKEAQLTSEIILTIATLLVRHEFCQMVADEGGCDALFNILSDNYENVTLARQALKLIKALSGNDDVKRSLVRSGIIPIVVAVLNRHMSDVVTCKLSLACISMLALREPTHGLVLYNSGAVEVIVDAIKRYPTVADIQKNACWCIRNMVARCKELNAKFLELGVEPLLNEAFHRYEREFGFDIKSALRDLECDIRLDEQWKGTGVQMDN